MKLIASNKITSINSKRANEKSKSSHAAESKNKSIAWEMSAQEALRVNYLDQTA